jgi:hypothetical protein
MVLGRVNRISGRNHPKLPWIARLDAMAVEVHVPPVIDLGGGLRHVALEEDDVAVDRHEVL